MKANPFQCRPLAVMTYEAPSKSAKTAADPLDFLAVSAVVIKRYARVIMTMVALAFVVFGDASMVLATEPELPEVENLEQLFDYNAFGVAILALAITALLVSFGVGGTVRIAKRAYTWIVSKI